MVEAGFLWMKSLLINMRKFAFILTIILISCKSTYNIDKESIHIKNRLQTITNENSAETKEYLEYFFPKDYWINKNKDSLLNHATNLINALNPNSTFNEYFYDYKTHINKHSKIISTEKGDFIIVNVQESYNVKKSQFTNLTHNIITHLNNNLMSYTDYDDKISVNHSSDILGKYNFQKKKWYYYNFNSRLLLHIYGIEISKEIVNAYYKEIYSKPKIPFDQNDFNDFKEIYSDLKGEMNYQNLDFDAYCKCIYSHLEKLDDLEDIEGIEIPDDYYRSQTHIENIFKCRILTTIHKK
jgi:hypothetical protein